MRAASFNLPTLRDSTQLFLHNQLARPRSVFGARCAQSRSARVKGCASYISQHGDAQLLWMIYPEMNKELAARKAAPLGLKDARGFS